VPATNRLESTAELILLKKPRSLPILLSPSRAGLASREPNKQRKNGPCWRRSQLTKCVAISHRNVMAPRRKYAEISPHPVANGVETEAKRAKEGTFTQVSTCASPSSMQGNTDTRGVL
jgi:hypothetical protein